MTRGDTVSKEYQYRAVINSAKPQPEAGLLLSNTETLLFLTTPKQNKKSLTLNGRTLTVTKVIHHRTTPTNGDGGGGGYFCSPSSRFVPDRFLGGVLEP